MQRLTVAMATGRFSSSCPTVLPFKILVHRLHVPRRDRRHRYMAEASPHVLDAGGFLAASPLAFCFVAGARGEHAQRHDRRSSTQWHHRVSSWVLVRLTLTRSWGR